MFNSPLLDVTIGLVLIFLLYSLLVTSIQEVFASLFSLRAKMLKRAIITGMLSNTSNDSKAKSIYKGFCNFFCNIFQWVREFFKGKDLSKSNNTIGDLFYAHPVIKNLGSSRFFDIPSYVSRSNFAKIIIDLLKEEATTRNIITGQSNADEIKIDAVINYYYQNPNRSPGSFLDQEPARILNALWKESNFNIEVFKQKLEGWFDDMMDRVSGWYKRHTQFRLFFIGLVIAVSFNIDTIKIANRLSVDKDAREKMVQLAIATADKYKDDPRVKKIITRDNQVIADTSAKDSAVQNEVFKEYKSQLDSAKRLLNGDIAKVNQIISVGWGWDSLYKPYEWKIYIASPTLKDTLLQMYRYLKNYSKLQDSVKKMNSSKDTAQFLARLRKWTTPGMTTPKNLDSMLRYITAFARTNAIPSVKDRQRDSLRIALTLQKWVKDSISDLSVKVIRVEKLENIKGKKDLLIAGYRHYDVLESVWYVLKNMWRGTAFFGFLLTAFAISLGAPFWFDLLNKLIKIRSAGKKEETGVTTENTPSVPSPKAAVEAPAQTTVNVKTQKAPGEEAVG